MIKESDKVKKAKAKQAKKEEKKEVIHADGLGDIKNPVETTFGKILIWVLTFLMFGGILISAIFAIVGLF